MPAPITSLPNLQMPCNFDRADGSDPAYGGIAEPAGAIKINTATGNTPGSFGYVPFFYEMSDSPEVESAEQSTIVHKFNCDYWTAQQYMATNPRGTYLFDSGNNVARVLSTKISPVPRTGMRGVVLTVTSEGEYPLFPNPPDEFDIETIEVNPSAEKHPRYTDLTYAERFLVRNADIVDNIDLAQQYKNQVNNIYTSSIAAGFTSQIATQQQAEAQELLFKKHKGEDSFYLAGYKITWSQYFWFPQLLNPGGYIEDPVYQGSLPAYFWSTTGTVDGVNIFSNTTVYNYNLYPNPNDNPVTPPYGLSWLRQADTIHLNRTWWRLTKTWIGAPLGQWDLQWYSQTLQPYQTSENQGNIIN